MVVYTVGIVSDGDTYIVLKRPNTECTIPSVSLRIPGTKLPEYREDGTIVDPPELPSGYWTCTGCTNYRFRVSSQYVAAVSPVFKTMLEGPWKESVPTESASTEKTLADAAKTGVPSSPVVPSPQGPCAPAIREITTHGWSSYALYTVLNIIHHRNEHVPRSVNLSLFVDITVVVNYFQGVEAVSLAGEMWLTRLPKPPTTYGKESIMWLFITYVFSWPPLFSGMSQLVAKHGEGLDHIETCDLPIVGEILEQLNDKRNSYIGSVFERLHFLGKELGRDRMGCSRKCRNMTLGTVNNNRHDMNKRLGTWNPPYDGVSITDVIDTLKSFGSTDWKDPDEKLPIHPRKCSFESLMQPTYDAIKEDLKKINITDFQRKKD
ncbi:hypothetical protein FBEOM_7404 [Fusarium beomiforme]|uniref:BTB domain-containing protein n=1 Tax=Fusarium beomiforme TaxID=44412 RepID=A0A9P5DY69_9HYPO|nr:hypothetical protein FBEOM_7404 [Fusarium beomiforme]